VVVVVDRCVYELESVSVEYGNVVCVIVIFELIVNLSKPSFLYFFNYHTFRSTLSDWLLRNLGLCTSLCCD